jgi:colanic acid/amylovoran biosynthesis protein
MKKISIIGATISGNRGAESMLSTVIGRVRENYPDVIFNIYSYYPDDDQQLCKSENIRIFSATPGYLLLILFPLSSILGLFKLFRLGFIKCIFPKSVTELGESNTLIDISGVSFMDGRVKFIPYNILTILPAMLLRTPVVKFAQALGPFKNPLVYSSAKIFLSGCTKIFARGSTTKKNLEQLKLHSDIIDNATDLAFLHRHSYSLYLENQEYVDSMISRLQKQKQAGKSIIGLCPSSVIASKANKEKWNYIQLLCDTVKSLNNQGYTLLLFPNATREKSRKLRNNDLPVIEKTARYLAAMNEYPDDLFLITKDINTHGIKQLMNCCDLNIVSRFHAMIASLSLCRPLVVMGWGHKYQEVMSQFELNEYVFDYKNNDFGMLVDKVVSALNSRELIEGRIRNKLPMIQEQSSRQFEYLFRMLNQDS